LKNKLSLRHYFFIIKAQKRKSNILSPLIVVKDMLFDVNPKERKEDLYDRERELNEIFDALKRKERLIVIVGMRRAGKSSVLRVSLKEAEMPHAILDVKEIYFEKGVISRQDIYTNIASYFSANLKFFERIDFNVRDLAKRIKGFRVMSSGIDIEPTANFSLRDLLERIDAWCERNGTRFVLAFDEAQYLRYGGGVRYNGIIAWSIDNLSNITIILTGSEVGMLNNFLKIEDQESPLFGRYLREVFIDRFTREQSIEFLRFGFRELGIKIDIGEIEEAVDMLDGVAGWLTYYGYYRGVRGLSHTNALNEVYRTAVRLVIDELERIIAPSRRRYAAILKAIAQGISSWSDIKRYVVTVAGNINDARFNGLLEKLMKYGYVEKRDDKYIIPDPVVRKAISEGLKL